MIFMLYDQLIQKMFYFILWYEFRSRKCRRILSRKKMRDSRAMYPETLTETRNPTSVGFPAPVHKLKPAYRSYHPENYFFLL